MRICFLLFLFIVVTSESVWTQNLESRPEGKFFKKHEIFEGYLLTLTTIDSTRSYDSRKPTIILNLYKLDKGVIDKLLTDSLFSRNSIAAEPELNFDFIDFNFDGIKDVTIPAGTDPRGNYGLHLYIKNDINKSLNYVKGFKEIGNPKPDTVNNLIQSFVVSSPPFCKFYRIEEDNILRDTGTYVEFKNFEEKYMDSLIRIELNKSKIKTYH